MLPFHLVCQSTKSQDPNRMELGNQLSALIVEASIRPAHYRDTQVDDRLLRMWKGMPRDMYSLMQHVVGATTMVM